MRKEEFSLQNQFILNVDLKHKYSSDVLKFRRGDTVVMLFSFFDDGEEYSLNSATKAMIHQKTSKGNIIESECTFTTYNGKRVVRFEVEDIAMVEIGYLSLLITVWQGEDVISIQPFNVYVYDDYMGGAGSFIELIQELQRQIENMVLDMNNAIKLTEKGVPNGVATLDTNGKIPWNQLPSEMDAYIKHIPETVYEHQVHGLRINNDGILEYESSPNTWTEVGFPEKQGGGSQTLEATVSVVNGIATITYTGIPTVAISKWATGDRTTSHFALNGTVFTGTTFNISVLGMHTLYYKDSNGIDYVKAFNVTSSMMNKPSLGIDIEDGFVTITPPASTTISAKKWAKGSQPVSYFIYLGTTFTGNTFEVTEAGTYTIYIKTSTGLEYVYEFNVTEDMLPVISKPTIILDSLPLNNNTVARYTIGHTIGDAIYKVTKYKATDSNTYVALSDEIKAGEYKERFVGAIDFAIASNRNKEHVMGYENEIGERTELVIYSDSQYIYTWVKEDEIVKEANLSGFLNINGNFQNANLILPNVIKDKTIVAVGQRMNNLRVYDTVVKYLTIPNNVRILYPIFASSTLNEVTVLNPDMEYISHYSGNYAFASPTTTIIFKASNSSTTKDFVTQSGNPKFVFQAT